jgi:hypothetical protein
VQYGKKIILEGLSLPFWHAWQCRRRAGIARVGATAESEEKAFFAKRDVRGLTVLRNEAKSAGSDGVQKRTQWMVRANHTMHKEETLAEMSFWNDESSPSRAPCWTL